jgi:hypothetical protein
MPLGRLVHKGHRLQHLVAHNRTSGLDATFKFWELLGSTSYKRCASHIKLSIKFEWKTVLFTLTWCLICAQETSTEFSLQLFMKNWLNHSLGNVIYVIAVIFQFLTDHVLSSLEDLPDWGIKHTMPLFNSVYLSQFLDIILLSNCDRMHWQQYPN